jgi:hypothetical protein
MHLVSFYWVLGGVQINYKRAQLLIVAHIKGFSVPGTNCQEAMFPPHQTFEKGNFFLYDF